MNSLKTVLLLGALSGLLLFGGELVGGFGLTTPFLRHFLGEREMFFPVAVDAAVARGAAS